MDVEKRIVHAAVALHDTMGFEVRGLFARVDVHKDRLADLQNAISDSRTVAPAHRDPALDIAEKVRAETMQLLADGLRKFAPDMAAELIQRWSTAVAEEKIRLEGFLEILRAEPCPKE